MNNDNRVFWTILLVITAIGLYLLVAQVRGNESSKLHYPVTPASIPTNDN